jgi:CO dehydrogenase nickel-insertion accessory protein CooC1
MGEIVTFYSYKGGVGRTMALANVAALLSKWGYKVLIIDWDLEAPGLEFFFKDYSNLDLEGVAQKEGVVDLLYHIVDGSMEPFRSSTWQNSLVGIKLPDSQRSLDFLTVGKRNEGYFTRVRDLDLKTFYEKQGGFFIEQLRDEWKEAYDFVLVDSRTGITDIGGVCTIQMPDILLLFAMATEQSLNGVIDVARKAYQARQKLPFDRLSLISVPIPSKFDTKQEFEISNEWLDRFALELSEIYANWLPFSEGRDFLKITRDFLEITKIPYIPYFSFGEKLAVLERGTLDPGSLGYAYETLAALIANKLESVEQLLRSRSEIVRSAIPSGVLKIRSDIHNILQVIAKPITVIGRAKNCHLEIPDEYDNVERYHAVIFYEEGIFTLVDGYENRPTRFGTFVNGVKVEPQTRVPLQSGDQIVLGGFRKKEARELARGACEIIFERRS